MAETTQVRILVTAEAVKSLSWHKGDTFSFALLRSIVYTPNQTQFSFTGAGHSICVYLKKEKKKTREYSSSDCFGLRIGSQMKLFDRIVVSVNLFTTHIQP